MRPTQKPNRARSIWLFESYRANAILVAIASFALPTAIIAWALDWQLGTWFGLMILAQILGVVCAGTLLVYLLKPVDRAALALDRCIRGEPVSPRSGAEQGGSGRLGDAATLLIQQFTEQRQLLESIQTEDQRTGLYNRRWTEERLAEDLSRARRGNANLTVALLRIADYGQGSAETGPLARQLVLQSLSKLLRGNTRVGDWSGHWDQDQLVLMLWEDHDKAATILARIETAVAAMRVVPTRGRTLTPRLRAAAGKYNRRDTPKVLLSKLSDALDHGEPELGLQLIDTTHTDSRGAQAASA